jgi:hypothetical protein
LDAAGLAAAAFGVLPFRPPARADVALVPLALALGLPLLVLPVGALAVPVAVLEVAVLPLPAFTPFAEAVMAPPAVAPALLAAALTGVLRAVVPVDAVPLVAADRVRVVLATEADAVVLVRAQGQHDITYNAHNDCLLLSGLYFSESPSSDGSG